MARVVTLFSGSSGNCHYISSGKTEILVDAGVCARSVERALSSIGTSLSNISAIFITHEHIDHTRGLEVISSRYKIPVFMTEISAKAMIKDRTSAIFPVLHLFPQIFTSDVGDITVRSFAVPHDSACCVGYTVSFPDGEKNIKIGIATDIGHIEDELVNALSGSCACILEANHDVEMLMAGPYPYSLKRRILSSTGHLSNEDCGALMAKLATLGTNSFLLAHLSKENNYPPTAELAAKNAVSDFEDIKIKIAAPFEPTELYIG